MSKTNDYMNKVIKFNNNKVNLGDVLFRYIDGTLRVIPADFGYHRGDLGKGRDTYFWNINSANRSSGHFGTGTYFFSKEADEEEVFYHDRPLQKINFKDYNNLFKPQDENDAFLLHRGLREVNYLRDLDRYNYDGMKFMLKRYGISEDDISRAFSKAKETYYSPKYQNASFDSNLDSLSTIFMKELGYNGVDVRGIKNFDNSSYGSVIYDLDKKKK